MKKDMMQENPVWAVSLGVFCGIMASVLVLAALRHLLLLATGMI